MAGIAQVAIKVENIEQPAQLYENFLGFAPTE